MSEVLDADDVVEVPQGLQPEAAAKLAEYVPAEPPSTAWRKATAEEKVEEVKESLLTRSSEVLEAAMAFQDIGENDESPPRQWVEEMGEGAAWRRFRVAKAAWRSGKTAPVGITVARNLYVGITKAAAQKATAPAQLNVAVQMNVVVPEFEEIDVD